MANDKTAVRENAMTTSIGTGLGGIATPFSEEVSSIKRVDPLSEVISTPYLGSMASAVTSEKAKISGYPGIPDTLSPNASVEIDYVKSKPKLTPPGYRDYQILSGLRLIHAMDFFQNLCDAFLEVTTLRIEVFNAELQDLLKDLKEASEKAKESMFWSVLQKIANSILAALSIVVGITLLTNGASAIVGGAMIFSGVVLITNMIMSEAGAWNSLAEKMADNAEDQQMIATLFPTIIGVVAGAVGFFGSISAFAYFGVATSALSTVLSVTQSTTTILNGGITIGKGFSDMHSTLFRAKLIKIKSLTTATNKMVDVATKSLENIFDVLDNDRDSNAKIIEQIIKTHQISVQRV